MLVRDLEREVTVFVSPGSVVAPHRITVWPRQIYCFIVYCSLVRSCQIVFVV